MKQPLPVGIREIIKAAQNRLGLGRLYVTFDPDGSGPKWEYHPFRRWLILRTPESGAARAGIATAVLAQTAYLGRGSITEVPMHLIQRYCVVLATLFNAINDLGTDTTAPGHPGVAYEGGAGR